MAVTETCQKQDKVLRSDSPSSSLCNYTSHHLFTALLVILAGGGVEDGGQGAITGSESDGAGVDTKGGCGSEG